MTDWIDHDEDGSEWVFASINIKEETQWIPEQTWNISGAWVAGDFDQEIRDQAQRWNQIIQDYENEV